MSSYRLKRETVDTAPITSTGRMMSVSRPHTGHTEMINLKDQIDKQEKERRSVAIQPSLDPLNSKQQTDLGCGYLGLLSEVE